jgi:iron(III) transport system permease protein
MVFFQRVILGDQSRFVTHGSKAFKPPGKGSKLAAVAVGLYSFVALIGPLLGLVYLSVSPFWRPVLTSDGLTLANFRKVFDTPNLTSAITTSLIVSVAAVAVVIPIGFCVALIQLKGRTHPIARWISDFVVQLPLGIPAAVFGVGFFYTYTREPFFLYGTKWVIVLVYVTLMLPFATRMLLSAMVALGNGYEEASRVSGAGAIFTYARITLPLIRPAVGGAGALMFVLLTHEFGASVLVRSPTTQVMGTALFDYWNFGSFPLTAAMAIVMGVITAIGVSIAMLVSGGRAFDQL